MSLETIYNLQELLAKQNMPHVLGKKANFRLLSDTDLTIGKVPFCAHFVHILDVYF